MGMEGDQALSLPTGDRRAAELAFLATLSGFIAPLALGVVQRWRWTFWLILVAFLFGVVRVPVATLQLTGSWRSVAQPGPSPSRAARCTPVRDRARHGGRLPSLRRLGGVLSGPTLRHSRRSPGDNCRSRMTCF
jgi:hypothetical protein